MPETGDVENNQPSNEPSITHPTDNPLFDIKPTFTPKFSIISTSDLRYVVKSVATERATLKVFNSLEEAIGYYQEMRNIIQSEEEYLRLNLGDFEMRYVPYTSFGKSCELTNKPTPIPQAANQIFDRENNKLRWTYQTTVKESDWQTKTFAVVSEYLNTDEGRQLVTDLKVTDIQLLTPNQAMQLSLEITRRLTKYYTKKVERPNPADTSTIVQLMKLGMAQKGNPQFEGNGVCRNFAAMVKGIFESLKYQQYKYNYLQNAYCTYQSGDNEVYDLTYKPDSERQRGGTVDGHAWNRFATIQGKTVTSTIVDPTWAKINSSNKIVDADYTRQRTVQEISSLSPTTKDKPLQIAAKLSIVKYYSSLVDDARTLSEIPLNSDTAAALLTSSAFLNYRKDYSHLTIEECQKQYLINLQIQRTKNLQQYFLQRISHTLRYDNGTTIQAIPEEMKEELIGNFNFYKQNLESADIALVYKLSRSLDEYPRQKVDSMIVRYVNQMLKLHPSYRYIPYIFRDEELQKKVLEILSKNQPDLCKKIEYNRARELKDAD